MMKHTRNIGLDIARILAILGIIVLHINGMGGVLEYAQTNIINYWSAYYVEIIAYCSVDLFALLSGYFGIMTMRKSSKRVIELISISMVYCLLITVIFIFLYPDEMGIKNILVGLFPILKGRYWYLYCYIPLALIQPFINSWLNRLSINQYRTLCEMLIILASVIPSLIFKDTLGMNSGYSFCWLLICYILGGYIKKTETTEHSRKSAIGFIIFIAVSFALLLGNLAIYIVLHQNVNYMVSYTSPLTLLMAISLMMSLKNIRFKLGLKTGRVIELLSILSFDIYLLHCHVLIFDIPWNGAFTWISRLNAIFIPIVIVLAALAVGAICFAVALIRNVIYKKIRFEKITFYIDSKIYVD